VLNSRHVTPRNPAGALLEGRFRSALPGGAFALDGGVFQGPFRLQANAVRRLEPDQQLPNRAVYLLGVGSPRNWRRSPAPALAAQAVRWHAPWAPCATPPLRANRWLTPLR